MFKSFITIFFILCLTACSVGPDFKLEKSISEEKYLQTDKVLIDSNSLIWEKFEDPILIELLKKSESQNLSIKQSISRMQEAREIAYSAGSSLYPQLNIKGDPQRFKISENVNNFGNFADQSKPITRYQGSFDAIWELDFFGGNRRTIEALEARALSLGATHEDIKISVLAEVARSYISLIGLNRRIAIAKDTIASQEKIRDLIKSRYDAGLVSELDLAKATAEAATTSSTINQLNIESAKLIHALAVLLGQAPSEISLVINESKSIPKISIPESIPIPSELLRLRPDVRVAEAQLHEATARVGVATADLFPKFTLTGTAGLRSDVSNKFGDSGSLFWSIGPTIEWPIFQGARLVHTLRAATANEEAFLSNYKSVVLKALAETEDSLVSYKETKVQLDLLNTALNSNERAYTLAEDLYSKGISDFITVLDSQRNLLNSRDTIAQLQARMAVDAIGLDKALGGGFIRALLKNDA